ncbi:MAG: nucleotide sugar dehydrogenase [Rhodobacteraceae bacterium]|nr:nucleotide sugar dehydrogenase [Paracoccaceae bacterium]
MTAAAEPLLHKLRAREATIGVVGLGYVGLPLCVAFAEAGVTVLGFDVDPEKPKALERGESYIKHILPETLAPHLAVGRLAATTDMARMSEPDAILVCVPTPLTKHFTPNLSFVESTMQAIREVLRPGQLIVLESTTYPGTTEEVVKPILEQSGLKAGEDFMLAFSPEREDPGNESFTTATIPKVVGADDAASLAAAQALYELFADMVVPVSTASTAEAVKITENVFRAVNIALVNELKLVFARMGIDVWEVIDAAKTKPFGFMPFYPGPGIGGHCIPIDPFYLTWKAKEFEIVTRFVELAGQINSAMPEHVISELGKALDQRFQRGLSGARVLVLGLAYKKNVDDMRESPSLRLIEKLEGRGAAVAYYDPFIPVVPPTRDHPDLTGRQSIEWDLDQIAGYDAVLIATDHDGVDYVGLAGRARLVVDTRYACMRAGAPLEKVVRA